MSTSQPQSLRQFVRAGAGAGKTWNLTRQVVSRALEYRRQHDKWPKTVMTTFTRKATQELKERLLTYCLQEEPQAIEFVQSSSFLMITTMHGLFDRFLRSHGGAMGLPSQYKVIDSFQGDFWRKKVIKELLHTHPQHSDILISYDIRRLLTLLKSYEDLYWYKKFRPTDKQDLLDVSLLMARHWGAELNRCVIEASREVSGEKWDDYLHYLKDLVRILESEQDWLLLQDQLEKSWGRFPKPRKSKKNPGLSESVDEPLKKCLERIKSFFSDPEYTEDNWDKAISFYKKFESLASDYMKALYEMKMKETSLEANDLENYSLKLVLEKPEAALGYHQDWDLWFIDEFQDTSPKQIEIIEQFMGDKPCYIVGDPQQSIYLFRGSRSEVFFAKQDKMDRKGDLVTQLQDNYRSQSQLLEFINQFFPFISDQFKTMNAKVDALVGQSSVVISQVAKDPELMEIDHIKMQIKELLVGGASPKDICILGRTNGDLDSIQKSLMKAGFPVISHSSANYFSRREILDAQSLLQWLINPWNNLNLMVLMRSPWMGLTDQQILEIIKDQEGAYWLSFKTYFEKNKDYSQGQKLLQALVEKREWGLGWVFRKLIISLGLLDYCFKVDSTGRREANLWKFINTVERVSREPGGNLLKIVEEAQLSTQLDDIGQNTDASSPVEPDKINLMTVHASKGLQFKYIFIPFMQKKMNKTTHANFCSLEEKNIYSFRVPLGENQQFIGTPLEKSYLNSMGKREEEESLRVLYVALTRAQERLFLSWTGSPEKSSWARLIQKFSEQNVLGEEVLLQSISEVEPAFYQAKESSGDVPSALVETQRMGVSPQSEKPQEEPYVRDDIMSSQNKRWKGVVLHKLFESLKQHDIEKVKELAQRWLPSDYEQVQEALEFVLEDQTVPFLTLIKEGQVEWGYQKEDKGALVERRVDLWCVHDDVLWIVDYKTGSTQFKKKAFKQMAEYGEALKEYLNWDKAIRYCAVYPFDKVIEIKR